MTRRRTYLLVAALMSALAICALWLVASAPRLISQGGANALVEREVRLRMARVAQQLDVYLRVHGELPQNLEQAGIGEIADPWGRSLRYKRLGGDDYLVFSVGPDGEPDTRDDVRREGTSLDYEVDSQLLGEAYERGTQ